MLLLNFNELEGNEKALIKRDGLYLLLPVVVSQETVGSLYIHAGLDPFFLNVFIPI